jgi:RHS repeat-associated protein
LSYDVTSNRITAGGYSYVNNGKLTAFSGPAGNTTVSYDAFDRATTITVASSSPTVNYDAFGRRVQKTFAGGMLRLYFYSANGQLLAEYDSIAAGAAPSRTTAYFAGQRVGQWTDRVGSKRADSGSAAQYYPYGEEITGTANDTQKFAQTYRESDSGLDYASARFYASSAGRFLTPDSYDASARLGRPQSWNRYGYSLSDPVNFRDQTGQYPVAGDCDWNEATQTLDCNNGTVGMSRDSLNPRSLLSSASFRARRAILNLCRSITVCRLRNGA